MADVRGRVLTGREAHYVPGGTGVSSDLCDGHDGVQTNLTNDPNQDYAPAWSPGWSSRYSLSSQLEVFAAEQAA